MRYLQHVITIDQIIKVTNLKELVANKSELILAYTGDIDVLARETQPK